MTDLAWLAASFSETLRAAEMPVAAEASGRFVQAIALLNPMTASDLYWAARITLVTDTGQLATFDRVFEQIFGGIVDTAGNRGDQAAPRLPRRSVDSSGDKRGQLAGEFSEPRFTRESRSVRDRTRTVVKGPRSAKCGWRPQAGRSA